MGCCLAQGLARGIYERRCRGETAPLAAGIFQGVIRAQSRWPTVDKEALAIVSGCKKREWMLHIGVTIFSDHRNLAYSFSQPR